MERLEHYCDASSATLISTSVWDALAIFCIAAFLLLLFRILRLSRPLLIEWLFSHNDNNVSSETNETICIVGASLSGLSLAQKAAEKGFRVVIFEKNNHSEGIWSTADGSANDWSQLQVDHYVYCDAKDIPTCQSYYPSGDQIRKFLNDKAQALLQTGRVEIRYECEVIKLEDAHQKGVLVEYLQDGQNHKECFSSVHVRTGTISRPRRLHLEGLDEYFQGRHCLGTSNAMDQMPIRDSKVVIIGMGAFAVENAKRAMERGAASVTLVAKSPSHVLPLYVQHYCTTQFLQLKVVEAEMDVYWKKLRELLKCAPKTDSYDLEDIAVHYNGMDHYKMTSSSQSDWFHAALALGAIDIVWGQVLRCESSNCIAVEGQDERLQQIPADVLIDCTGHECDTSLLDDIPLTCTMFGFNGKLTHNLGLDKRPKPIWFGPRCEIPTFPPGGYGILCDLLDIITMCSLVQENSFYTRFIRASKNYQYPSMSFIDKVDTVSWIQFLWKSMAVGFPEVACKMVACVYNRYQICLALEKQSAKSWYNAAVKDWNMHVSNIQCWQQERKQEKNNVGCSEEEKKENDALPYPWPEPAPLQPLPVGRRVYQMLLFIVCVIGFDTCVGLLEYLPYIDGA